MYGYSRMKGLLATAYLDQTQLDGASQLPQLAHSPATPVVHKEGQSLSVHTCCLQVGACKYLDIPFCSAECASAVSVSV